MNTYLLVGTATTFILFFNGYDKAALTLAQLRGYEADDKSMAIATLVAGVFLWPLFLLLLLYREVNR